MQTLCVPPSVVKPSGVRHRTFNEASYKRTSSPNGAAYFSAAVTTSEKYAALRSATVKRKDIEKQGSYLRG